MKKTVLIIIGVFSLLAVGGGAYLYSAIKHTSHHLNKLVMLHQVEIMREHLALDIHQVQRDIYSLNSKYPESADAILSHLDKVNEAMNACFNCHHSESVVERLRDLRGQITDYSGALKNALSLRSDRRRFTFARDQATVIGESLIAKVGTMIVLTGLKLSERTEHSIQHVDQSKNIVILLVIAGPLAVALFGFATMISFSKPIRALLAAVKRLRAGELDVRVDGLKNEFAELAVAFNDMAGSLRERLREIRESESRYRLLFESAADAIFILESAGDRPGAIVAANQAAVAMHGYTIQELLSMRIQDLDAPEAAQAMLKRLEQVLKGERVKAEIDHVRKDGTVFPVEISAAVFEAGGHRYILAIDRDITDRKHMAETLQRAEQLRITGELATGLAHEIKNPLAGIKVTMEALAEETCLADGDRDLLFKVVDEIRRIDGLVKGLLNFARPPRPHFIATDVNEVLDSAAHLALQNRVPSKNAAAIDVKKSLSPDLPEVIADPLQLKQVFMNLIMNAVDAMPDHGTVCLETSLEDAGCAIKVVISDTGAGMDARVLNRIFQPFFTTKTRGTGLGLAISKRLIEEQGGRIAVESSEGQGATFRVTIPCDGRKGTTPQ